MATRKNATKQTKSAKTQVFNGVKVNKSDQKRAIRAAKGLGTKAILICLAFLVFGIGLGAGAWGIVCRKDTFELIGQQSVSIEVNTGSNSDQNRYVDEGVKVIAFGKDETASVVIETNLKQDENGFYADEAGKFYIKYTSNCFKFGTLFKVQKIRLVEVVESSEGGQ